MCIIIAKYKNGILPKEKDLKNSFECNSDGAGFMYVDNGKVVIDKGYMNYKSFINRYIELCAKFNNFKNKALVIHCRIGTSSGNTKENTHPYPISRKEKMLHKTYIETDLGVVHNGIITQYTPHWKNPTTNDTQEFIIKYLTPLYENYKEFYKNKYIMDGIEEIIGSKLVFLNTKEELYFVGKNKFIEDNKGLFFSNSTYQDRKIYYSDFDYDKYFLNSKYEDYIDTDFSWQKDYDRRYDKKYNNYYKVCCKEKATGEIIYAEDLEFLDSEWYLSKNFNTAEQIGNDYTAYDIYTYDIFEIIDNEAYYIGNIFEDNIEIFNQEYVKIV